jgi:flagellar biosynthesis regulator FlaF
VIAEGFIAVEAQEPEQVKKIGRTVLDLSAALGVRKAVVARSNAIIEFADKKDWTACRKELDGAFTDVKQAMNELHDEELAQLVSLGGWLRGTEALAQVVSRNYTKDSAGLLHQPALLDYFDHRLAHMAPRRRSDEVVAKIEKRLPEIRPLIGEADSDISRQSVDQIREIVHDLVIAVDPTPP